MRRRKLTLVSFVVVTFVVFGATLLARNTPLLGLDLKGGISVVLAPVDEADNDTLDQTIEIIRNRVDALGVAEPEITRQGSNILVQLPGIDDQERALELVGTTAELRFRPVLRELPAEGTTLEDLGIDPNATTTTVAPDTTTTVPGETTTVPPETTTTVPQTAEERRAELEEIVGISVPTTPREEDVAENTVVLPEYDRDSGEQVRRWELGPAAAVGTAVDSARATSINGRPVVEVDLKDGDQGADQVNALAVACRNFDATCPAGRMAIVLDGRVQVAAGIDSTATPPFGEEGELVITGDYSFGDAKDIALALKYGSLPVELETQSTQKVSATLGNDAKNAGIAAGVIGLALVSVYVIAYYRLLGLLALASLGLSYMLLWTVIGYLGEHEGLALTLAGIMGIVVSIGVSLDSNVVYFEHMKEDVRNGRTPRSSADRSFAAAFSTILKADIASLIGAFVLYFLTVGAVRGFAFFLGLSMLLDLAATYFFLGPAVQLLGRRPSFTSHPHWYGLPKPRDGAASAAPVEAVATTGVTG